MHANCIFIDIFDPFLSHTTYASGAPMNPVQLDTSTVATDTIAYVATASTGLTSTRR